jgi:hypothetical protein
MPQAGSQSAKWRLLASVAPQDRTIWDLAEKKLLNLCDRVLQLRWLSGSTAGTPY